MFDVSIHFAPPLAPALATSRPHISGPTKSIGGSRIQQSAAPTRPLADGIAPGRAASAPAATRSTARRHALEMWCGVGQEAERAPGRARVVGRQLRALGSSVQRRRRFAACMTRQWFSCHGPQIYWINQAP
jgi:hypothetical protein